MHGVDLSALDWTKCGPALVWAQFLAAAAWLGVVLGVRSLCVASRYKAEPEEAGRLALGLHARWASFWLLVSIVAAALRVIPMRATLADAPPLWGAIAVVALMLVLHLTLWRRAHRIAHGAAHLARVSNGWSREISLGD